MKFFVPKKILLKCFIVFFCSSYGFANIHDKSRAGINYGLAFKPAVSRLVGGSVISLDAFHRGGINAELPYNQYLIFGFGFDYTLLMSPRMGHPDLNLNRDAKKISTTFLGLHGLIKPQIPFSTSIGDLGLYTALELGFGASTPITFGTQALSDYEFQGASSFPSPFPLYLETTAMVGVEMFFSELVGIDIGVGYRDLWVAHPFVNTVYPDPSRTPDSRKVLWYDVGTLFAQLSVKMAF